LLGEYHRQASLTGKLANRVYIDDLLPGRSDDSVQYLAFLLSLLRYFSDFDDDDGDVTVAEDGNDSVGEEEVNKRIANWKVVQHVCCSHPWMKSMLKMIESNGDLMSYVAECVGMFLINSFRVITISS
jgi:hypothetical protein